MNHLKGPPRHRQYVRTSNLAERAFEEERRRTKVIPHLWDKASLVKLVFAVLIRVSERWGKKQYSEFEQHQIRALRQSLGLDQLLDRLQLGPRWYPVQQHLCERPDMIRHACGHRRGARLPQLG